MRMTEIFIWLPQNMHYFLFPFHTSMCLLFETISTLSKLNLKMLFTCETNMLHLFLSVPRVCVEAVWEKQTPPLMMQTNKQEVITGKVIVNCSVK